MNREHSAKRKAREHGDASDQQLFDLVVRMTLGSVRTGQPRDTPDEPHPTRLRSKDLVGGVIGNVLEWFDFAVFGFFAPVIGQQFFPADDPLDSLLGAFGVFAAAYVMRPFGGVLFGIIGDRLGRKKALLVSVMLMALPTCLIGLLPTHAQIGGLAPVLLLLLRMLQGLSAGGELVGSITFIAETAPAPRRGYLSSFVFASCYAAMALGSLCAVVLERALGPEALASWGWRLPFLAGIAIGWAGMWMRRELDESPAFKAVEAAGSPLRRPLLAAAWVVPWRMLHVTLLTVLVGGGFYVLFVWWPTLLSRFVVPQIPQAMALNTLSMILLVMLVPIAGQLSDTWGRKPLLVMGAAGMTFFSVPLFLLVAHGSILSVAFAQLCFTLLMSLFIGPIPATLAEMVPACVRYSAIGLAYNISQCAFGGTAPLLATWLVKRYQSVLAAGLLLTVLSALSFVAVLALPEPGAREGASRPAA